MLEVRSSAAVMDGEKFLGLVTRSDVLNYLRRQVMKHVTSHESS